jgi:hypothetical protein
MQGKNVGWRKIKNGNKGVREGTAEKRAMVLLLVGQNPHSLQRRKEMRHPRVLV